MKAAEPTDDWAPGGPIVWSGSIVEASGIKRIFVQAEGPTTGIARRRIVLCGKSGDDYEIVDKSSAVVR